MGYPYTTLEKITAAEHNEELRRVIEEGMNAGETINGATLPVPCYVDPDDEEWYACDANDVSKCAFRGFAVSNSTNGNPIDIQFTGIVGGFSGLTVGVKYYVQDTAGTIGTSIGTNTIPVGIAVSATEILIIHEEIYVSGSFTSRNATLGASQNVDTDETVTLNARPKKIIWRGQVRANAWSQDWYDEGEMQLDAQGNAIFGHKKGNNQNNSGAFLTSHPTSLQASKTDSSIGITTTTSINSISDTGFVYRTNMTTLSGGGGQGWSSGNWVAVL